MDKLGIITLKTPGGQTAEVSSYGAQLLTWRNEAHQDYLFLSKNAVFQPRRPTRGGVPISFSQVIHAGTPDLSSLKHGFAQHRQSSVVEKSDSSVTLEWWQESAEKWVYPFDLRMSSHIELRDDHLEQHFSVAHFEFRPIQFTAALHTYFAVSDISNVKVEGLQGLTYHDGTDKWWSKKREEAVEVVFAGEVDRAYIKAPDVIKVHDSGAPGGGRTYEVHKQGFPDAVLWNPGAERGASISDLGDPEWRRMVCLGPGVVVPDVSLEPRSKLNSGPTWTASQCIRIHRGGGHHGDSPRPRPSSRPIPPASPRPSPRSSPRPSPRPSPI